MTMAPPPVLPAGLASGPRRGVSNLPAWMTQQPPAPTETPQPPSHAPAAAAAVAVHVLPNESNDRKRDRWEQAFPAVPSAAANDDHAAAADPFAWIRIHPLFPAGADFPFDHAGQGETALMWAKKRDYKEIEQILRRGGAKE